MESEMILDDDFVIAKRGLSLYLVQVSRYKPVYISNHKVNISNAIGKPFGSYFKIRGHEICYVERSSLEISVLVETGDAAVQKDNRSIVDDGKSQKLTKDDIEDLKAKGISSEEIIGNLVENSSTFKEKSAFAQEKYLKKKKEKYMEEFQFMMPNTRLLAQMYYSHNPLKICNMRMDSLSQMLSYCNVMSGKKCIVLDGIQSLLVAAVLERLGNKGCIVHIYPEPAPTSTYRQAISSLNLPRSLLSSMVFSIQFQEAVLILNSFEDELPDIPYHQPGTSGDGKYRKLLRKLERIEMRKEAKRVLLDKDMDCLLVASKYEPLNALCLLNFMANSRPFAIHAISSQPLVECYTNCKAKGNVINMNITESFLRNYQVLPERTHPRVTDSGSGGYLLTGVKVEK